MMSCRRCRMANSASDFSAVAASVLPAASSSATFCVTASSRAPASWLYSLSFPIVVHMLAFSVSMAALSLRRSSCPDSRDLMIALSCVCADSYFWKYFCSRLPPGMNLRTFRAPVRSARFGSRSVMVVRSSLSVLATRVCASPPPPPLPAFTTAAGRSSIRLDTAADARRSLSPIEVMDSTFLLNSGARWSIAASSLANAAARWASSLFFASSTGMAPAACSSFTSGSGSGGVSTRPAAVGAAAAVGVAAGEAVEPRSRSDMVLLLGRCVRIYGALPRLLAPAGPVHPPAVRLVEGTLGTVEVVDLTLDDDLAVLVADQRDGADTRAVAGVIQQDLDRRRPDRRERCDPVGRRPVGRPFVDQCEYQDALELVRIAEVNEQVLASGHPSGPVVAVEPEQLLATAVTRSERVAERLDDTLGAVTEFIETAEVEVELGRLPEQSARRRPGVPVEVDLQHPPRAAVLGQRNRRRGLRQPPLRQGHRLRLRRGGRLRCRPGSLGVVDAHCSAPHTAAAVGSRLGSSSPAIRRLRAIDEISAAPMNATPIRPVTISGTSYSMVMSRMTARAPMAQSAPCSR